MTTNYNPKVYSFRQALDNAEWKTPKKKAPEFVGRPEADASPTQKKNYAERLSRHVATMIANALRPDRFDGILPNEDGTKQETTARTGKGVKKLDVNYSTRDLGLALGISVKTVNYRDPKSNRYTKNYTRVDNELRAEAMDYHLRQPYAVLVGVVCVPQDACDDKIEPEEGGRDGHSSFGQAVKIFRYRSGRKGPKDQEELFEHVFVAAYEWQEPNRGDVWFFDVEDAPPRYKAPPPERRLTFEQLIARVKKVYDDRNNPEFKWADY